MSDFFDSDIVREELQEINDLQLSIYKNAMKFGTFSREDKVEHIEKLTELLEKQKQGKKKMKQLGRVSIPQEAFLNYFNSNE